MKEIAVRYRYRFCYRKRKSDMVAFVDDEDFEWASQFTWVARRGSTGNHHAVRREGYGRDYGYAVMHRELLGLSPGQVCKHINGNNLDNRRCNLRVPSLKEK